MSAITIEHIGWLILINLILVITGFYIAKNKMILAAWLMMITAVVAICMVFASDDPVLKMLAIIATTFTGMKLITAPLSYGDKAVTLTFLQWASFAVGWVGMKPQPFGTLGGKPVPGALTFIVFGISRIAIGGALILLVHILATLRVNPQLLFVVAAGTSLIALSLILHFGLLSVSAGMWRLQGAGTYLLFREPGRSTSLAQFWGKRWNLAFIEMITITIYRPVKYKLGNGPALVAAFAFSGILHELALSVPVNSGYGLPTIYFIIQFLATAAEKGLQNRGWLQNKTAARLWLYFWLIAPAPLLFHDAFLRQVVWLLVGLG